MADVIIGVIYTSNTERRIIRVKRNEIIDGSWFKLLFKMQFDSSYVYDYLIRVSIRVSLVCPATNFHGSRSRFPTIYGVQGNLQPRDKSTRLFLCFSSSSMPFCSRVTSVLLSTRSFRLVALVFFGFAPRSRLVPSRRLGARHFYVLEELRVLPKTLESFARLRFHFRRSLRANDSKQRRDNRSFAWHNVVISSEGRERKREREREREKTA